MCACACVCIEALVYEYELVFFIYLSNWSVDSQCEGSRAEDQAHKTHVPICMYISNIYFLYIFQFVLY